jgi:hypothetical protein
MAIAGVIVFFLFFMSLGGDSSANDETENMGQAHHASTATDIPGSTSYTSGGTTTGGYNGGGTTTGGYNSGNAAGSEALEELVDEAVEDIQQAEEEQLKQSEGMLSSALSSIGNVSTIIYSFLFAVAVVVRWFLLLPGKSILTFATICVLSLSGLVWARCSEVT